MITGYVALLSPDLHLNDKQRQFDPQEVDQ